MNLRGCCRKPVAISIAPAKVITISGIRQLPNRAKSPVLQAEDVSAQAQKIVEFAGANRFVWSKALALNLSRLENKQPLLWYFELVYWLGLWKQSEEYGFLKSVHSQPLQQALKDLPMLPPCQQRQSHHTVKI